MRTATLIMAGLILGGCSIQTGRDEASLRAQFTPVADEAGFVQQVTGRDWQSDEIRVRFLPDRRLSGTVNGVPVTGNWRWSDGLLCSDFRVGDSGGDGCSEIGIKPGELLVVPLSGSGAPYTYTEVNG
jgi:hypothetical protein